MGKRLKIALATAMAGVFLAVSMPAAFAATGGTGTAVTGTVSPVVPAGTTGSSSTPVLKWFGQKVAGILAKDAGKSVTQVEAVKTRGEKWSAVAQALGVNPATFKSQLSTLRHQVFLNRIRAGAIVAVLAKASGKTAQEVRALKQGKTWQAVASSLGLNWTGLLPSIRQGVKARETVLSNRRFMTRFLAKKSGKTVKEIIALKKQDKNWPAVATALGITKQELGQALAAHRLNEARRKVSDGVFTSLLAKASGKTAQEIHTLKLQDKKWKDVVQSLGLDWTSIGKEARQEIKARETSQLKTNFLVGYLAKATGKKPAQIRALKTKSNTWIQVGQSLGL